jgi:hypothetical protein
MKTRWKILIAVGIFMGVSCAVSFVMMRVQPENQVEAYKKFLREKGEKLEISKVLPPPVSPGNNCADAVEDAFRTFSSGGGKIPNTMQMVAPGKAMTGWARPDVRGYDFTNSWEDFGAAVAADRPAIELLKQVFERPELDFHLDYQKGFLMLLPHLAPLKRSAQRLSAAAICDLHEGNTGSAATNLCAMLGLVQADRREGVIISQLVRIAMAAIAASATWELLQYTNVPDAQLATLQKSWEQQEFISAAENSFLMERAIMSETMKKMRASHTEFRSTLGMASSGSSSSTSPGWTLDLDELFSEAKLASGEMMWRASWSYSEELHMLQADQVMLGTLRAMNTNQFYKTDCDAMRTQLASLGVTNAGEAFFRALKIPDFREEFDVGSLTATIWKTIRMEAARRVVITAIALKRFQLKHGKLPETLGELAPEFFTVVPLDPYDGKPLRYHPNADGTYLLYCVGEDGVDDGGDPTVPASIKGSNLNWQNTHARDWVWPQPASAEETKNFYDEQAKKAAEAASAMVGLPGMPPPSPP